MYIFLCTCAHAECRRNSGYTGLGNLISFMPNKKNNTVKNGDLPCSFIPKCFSKCQSWVVGEGFRNDHVIALHCSPMECGFPTVIPGDL